jgi:hypothetical protein
MGGASDAGAAASVGVDDVTGAPRWSTPGECDERLARRRASARTVTTTLPRAPTTTGTTQRARVGSRLPLATQDSAVVAAWVASRGEIAWRE